MSAPLAVLRWERERARAEAAGLFTTAQAARRMNVPIHIVKAWEREGLIRNRGVGGKGYPALYDWGELRRAPERRAVLRPPPRLCDEEGCDRPHRANGLCTHHYEKWRRAAGLKPPSRPLTRSERASWALGKGVVPHPPRALPYRPLAMTCPDCGMLRTTPDHMLRKDAGKMPACPRCRVARVKRYQRNREKVDEEFRRKLRKRVDRNRKQANSLTLDTAHNHGKMWTGPELEIVARDDLSARQVAVMLGRTLYAVKHARQALKDDPRKIKLAQVPLRRTGGTSGQHAVRVD